MFFCWVFLVCLFIHYGSTVMPVNQHDKILPKSEINSPSTIEYDNTHLKSKTEIRNVQKNSGKVQVERTPITETNRVYSPIMPIVDFLRRVIKNVQSHDFYRVFKSF